MGRHKSKHKGSSQARNARSPLRELSEAGRIFKVLDPVCQGILLILFLYCMDMRTTFSYRIVLMVLIAVQIASCIVNYIIRPAKQYKKQRSAFLACAVLYVAAIFLTNSVLCQFSEPNNAGNVNVNIDTSEAVYIGVGLVIAFWYNVVCVLETRKQESRILSDYGY